MRTDLLSLRRHPANSSNSPNSPTLSAQVNAQQPRHYNCITMPCKKKRKRARWQIYDICSRVVRSIQLKVRVLQLWWVSNVPVAIVRSGGHFLLCDRSQSRSRSRGRCQQQGRRKTFRVLLTAKPPPDLTTKRPRTRSETTTLKCRCCWTRRRSTRSLH